MYSAGGALSDIDPGLSDRRVVEFEGIEKRIRRSQSKLGKTLKRGLWEDYLNQNEVNANSKIPISIHNYRHFPTSHRHWLTADGSQLDVMHKFTEYKEAIPASSEEAISVRKIAYTTCKYSRSLTVSHSDGGPKEFEWECTSENLQARTYQFGFLRLFPLSGNPQLFFASYKRIGLILPVDGPKESENQSWAVKYFSDFLLRYSRYRVVPAATSFSPMSHWSSWQQSEVLTLTDKVLTTESHKNDCVQSFGTTPIKCKAPFKHFFVRYSSLAVHTLGHAGKVLTGGLSIDTTRTIYWIAVRGIGQYNVSLECERAVVSCSSLIKKLGDLSTKSPSSAYKMVLCFKNADYVQSGGEVISLEGYDVFRNGYYLGRIFVTYLKRAFCESSIQYHNMKLGLALTNPTALAIRC
ncbi:hypothetical protein CLF_103002 [Clonorchis sinensis]|uniref:Uncharacterized protein n=1 Tax=Clonorchis sinensis TaxID=79923 RepID=G7Y8V8_CLOSI|nr:hypothetical protein CLF_103002 [Clonorchis sinensis]